MGEEPEEGEEKGCQSRKAGRRIRSGLRINQGGKGRQEGRRVEGVGEKAVIINTYLSTRIIFKYVLSSALALVHMALQRRR